MNRLIFLFFFLLVLRAHGQDFQSTRLKLEEMEIRFTFSSNDSLYLLGGNNTWKYARGNWIKSTSREEIDPLVNHKNYSPIQVDSIYYAVERGLGQVYRFDTNGLKRIDKSFSMQNNFGHAVFEYDGQLYSYGGYGFWNYHPYFVRYSWQNSEWNLVIHENNTLPQGRTKPFFQHNDEFIYLLGGEGENGFLNDVVKVNLNSMERQTLGEIDSSFPYNTSPWNYFELNGEQYYLFQDLDWVKINIENNQFQMANTATRFTDHNLAANPIIYNDSLYLFTRRNKMLLSNIISIDDFEKLFDSPQPLYATDKKMYIPWIALGFLCLLFFRFLYVIGLWQRRKKTSPTLQQNYLTLDKTLLILSEAEKEVLSRFILTKKIELSTLNDLPSFIEYSSSYQKKAIKETIKKLAAKLESNKRISKKLTLNEVDSKTNTYELKGKVFIYRGWYNHLWT